MANGYAAWVNNDCGSSFAEFMGFEPPKLEEQRDGARMLCRYVKNGVKGEWCHNKTTAYKSYQAAKKTKRSAITQLRAELRAQVKSLSAEELDLLRRVTGRHRRGQPRDYYSTNFHYTDAQGPAYELAMTLVGKELMGVRNLEDNRRYFEVTPKGCRMIGVPESIIEEYRYSTGWYE
jgi:hypothetical protein